MAIKLYRLPDQRQSRRQALREARRSALLDSPRITRVHDVLVEGNDLAVIMQYVPGCDLRDVLRGTRLSLPASLSVASDIAAALAAARLCDMVHGDIKPANILIADTGRAVLTDFGVARVGRTASAVGFSHSALTPEHVRGDPLCPASDLFALGVLLYHMVCGERPFGEGMAAGQAMCDGRFVPLAQRPGMDDVPPELDILVTRLLAPEPRRRPDSIHAVRQGLRTIALGLPLGESAPVRAETEAFYRDEGAADVPPGPVAAFGEQSRRRRYARKLRLLVSRYPRVTLSASVVVLAFGVLAWQLRPAPCVALESPDLRVDAATTISAGISRDWLQAVLRRGLEEQAGRIEVVGAPGDTGPRVIGRDGEEKSCRVDRRLQLRLECRQALCLVSLFSNALPRGPGVPLFANASLAEWRSAVERVAAAASRRYRAAGAAP